jgi:DNA repair exonuclease SbcCD ATPase subunit
MPTLKISLPVYKLGSYAKHEVDGQIEVFSTYDNLSDAYDQLVPQIDHLIEKLQSQACIAKSIHELQMEFDNKTTELKNTTYRLRRATKQYQRLKVFLQQFGVNDSDNSLIINNNVLSLDLLPDSKVEIVDDGDDEEDLFIPEF